MHRFPWKRVTETLVNMSRSPSPSSQISSSCHQSLRLLSSISTHDNDCKQQSLNRRSCSVQSFFEECGFSQTQIESIASRFPEILRCVNPEKTFKPKISFLYSIGITEADVAKMVTRHPLVLHRSLKDHLIPAFDLLKSLLGGEDNAICLVKNHTSAFRRNVPDTLAVNLSILRKHGVPESDILKTVSRSSKFAAVMFRVKPDWLHQTVEFVMKLGFDNSSIAFRNAVVAMGLHNESTWEDKLMFYQELGFSKDEIFSMFRKQPLSLALSQKKVSEYVEFYNNKFHWGPSELVIRPNLLMYGLHSRIIPRCSVLQVLWSKNRITKSLRLVSILVLTDKVFLEKYVTKYEGEVLEVLDAYQGKLHFDEFTFDSGKNEELKAV